MNTTPTPSGAPRPDSPPHRGDDPATQVFNPPSPPTSGDVPPTFTLPTIPQRPSEQPPSTTDGTLVNIWVAQWTNYRWAMQIHSDAACREAQHSMREAVADVITGIVTQVTEALGKRSKPTFEEVMLKCMDHLPPNMDHTRNTWAGQVRTLALEVWGKMELSSEG